MLTNYDQTLLEQVENIFDPHTSRIPSVKRPKSDSRESNCRLVCSIIFANGRWQGSGMRRTKYTYTTRKIHRMEIRKILAVGILSKITMMIIEREQRGKCERKFPSQFSRISEIEVPMVLFLSKWRKFMRACPTNFPLSFPIQICVLSCVGVCV